MAAFEKLNSVLLCLIMPAFFFAVPGCGSNSDDEVSQAESQVNEPNAYDQPNQPQKTPPKLHAPVAPAEVRDHNELEVREQPATIAQEQFGTVTYIPVEGGFWGIVTDTGKKYDPVNLSEEYQKEGLQVKFRAEELKDRVSFHMWGTLVRILEISKR